jgi:SAM-dependent methyltransferase
MSELKSNIEWKQWGKEDPLLGVAAWKDKEKGGASPWTDADFYALGESDWRDFYAHWQHYGVNTSNCLEIGCGAGRITKQLSNSFEHVYAVDVSEDMIRYAQRAVKKNVEFSLIDGIHLPQADGSVKAIFSTHVIQHLDNAEIGHAYFREFYRVLDDGGTIMIHVPVIEFPGGPMLGMMRALYALSRLLGNIRAGFRRRMGIKTMRGTRFSLQALYDFLAGLGFKNIEIRVFPTKSNGDLHPFVFATK